MKKFIPYILVALLFFFGSMGICSLIYPLKTQETVPDSTATVILQETTQETEAETFPQETEQEDRIAKLIFMAGVNKGKVQQEISTWEDAVAYFDQRYPTLSTISIACPGTPEEAKGMRLISSGESGIARGSIEFVPRYEVVQGMNYLLSDDMEIYSVVALCRNGTKEVITKVTNCIKTEDGYEFRDPVGEMKADEESRNGRMLPDAKVQSYEEYFALLGAIPELCEVVDRLYIIDGFEQITVFNDDDTGEGTITYPEVEPLWGNAVAKHEKVTATESATANTGNTPHQNLKKIDQYNLYHLLGGVTLTEEEAIALVNATPEEAKEKIKTAPDLLMYMLAANLQDNGGCYCDNWDGRIWHTNMSVKEVMEKRLGNCGSCANLANYMLEGDYEEIGFIDHTYYPGGGGGHIYNYILHEGKYYIVDFSWFIFNGYSLGGKANLIVPVADKLEDWASTAYMYYGDVCLMTAYTSPGRHYPIVYHDNGEEHHYYIPEQAVFDILLEADDGYQLKQIPFDTRHYDWTKFWED